MVLLVKTDMLQIRADSSGPYTAFCNIVFVYAKTEEL